MSKNEYNLSSFYNQLTKNTALLFAKMQKEQIMQMSKLKPYKKVMKLKKNFLML